MSFFESLEIRTKKISSLLCIGLDPHISQLPEPTAEAAIQFCVNIIEKTTPFAAAYKPNSAFFEALGPGGIDALLQVMKVIPADIPVILDVKRGDIETTAQAYATSCYDVVRAQSVTLSPYMGWDSIHPFVSGKNADKGAFILCKTSNPSSKDFQDAVQVGGLTLYESVARKCSEWNSNLEKLSLGLVVGATDLKALFQALIPAHLQSSNINSISLIRLCLLFVLPHLRLGYYVRV